MEIELYHGERSFTAELSVDAETGEVIGGENLELLVKRNPIGTIAYILTAEKKEEMIQNRIDELQYFLNQLKKNANNARESLKFVMQQTGTTRIENDDKTFRAVLSVGADECVDVFDERQIPVDYLREIPASYQPDKKLIKKAIKDGFIVPGATLQSKDRLTLRP